MGSVSENDDGDLVIENGEEDTSVAVAACIGSAQKSAGKFAIITRKGNGKVDVCAGVKQEDSNGYYQRAQDQGPVFRERCWGHETSQSMEAGYFETGSFSENASDQTDWKSQCNSVRGSDADDDDDGSNNGDDDDSHFSGISLKHAQEASKPPEWLFQNIEHELAFGGSDWGEYFHENRHEIDCFMDLSGAMEAQDAGHSQIDGHHEVNQESSTELTELEELDVGYLSEASAEVRGTGRPDLDDVEDGSGSADERPILLPFRSISPDGAQSIRSGRLDVEDNGLCSAHAVCEGKDVGAPWDPCGTSGIVAFEEETEDMLSELHGQIDVHVQEKLQSALAKGLSEQLDGRVAMEREALEDAEEAHGLKVFGGKNRGTVAIKPIEHCAAKTGQGMNQPVLGTEENDAEASVRGVSKLLPEMNFQATCTTTTYSFSHDIEQEDHSQAGTVSESVGDDFRNKDYLTSLSSRGSDVLPHMDVAKVGRAKFTSAEVASNGSNVQEQKRAGVDWAAEDLGPDELSRYVEALEVKETYIDTVLDMEDILFGAEERSGAHYIQPGKVMSSAAVRPARDGSFSASTSSEPALMSRQLRKSATLTEVEWVEVVGAFQQLGGASLGDRVVGVKEHTVYRIKVQGGDNQWEVRRRYRDFVALHNQLQHLFNKKASIHLPTPWEKVKAESRNFFGNTSPNVVEVRSGLVQVCLQSLLQAGPPLSSAAPLLRFLLPDEEGTTSRHFVRGIGESPSGSQVLLEDFLVFQEDVPSSDTLNSKTEHDQDDGGNISVFGKTIRLIVQVHKKKSLKQQLQAQHSTCAGCYKHLELALGLVPELVQNWGWRGPRLCEYSGQLFCSTCHLNETAVIPAWVLQRWDFSPRQVSQLAKAFLDSIYDKPMLCVSAVNPYLYARVPVLAHLMDIRRKLSKMLVYIRCPARARLQAMLGSRRYLLENNDFFALRDLVDLSKGAFAVLPGYMQAVLLKFTVHIKRECSACRELGEACGAGELCDDQLDVLYPYEEENITRCRTCHLRYHKRCFYKYQESCSCQKGQSVQTLNTASNSSDIFSSQLGTDSSLRISLPSCVAFQQEDSPSTSSVVKHENKVKAKKNLLASFLGTKDTQVGSQLEKQKSLILNMSALLSPLEL